MAFCSNCGTQFEGTAKFCPVCGAGQSPAPEQPAQQAQPYQQAAYQPAQPPAYQQPQQPAYQQPQQPAYQPTQQAAYQQPVYQPQAPVTPVVPGGKGKKKKSKAPLVIVIVVVIAALAAAAVFTNGFGLLGDGGGSPASLLGGIGKASFTADKTNYAPGGAIRVSVKGVTQEMLDNGAFVGIYGAGAANNDSIDSANFDQTGSSTVTITAPEEDGNYELRMFKVYSGEASELTSALLNTVSFTVGSATQPAGNDPTTKGGNNNGKGSINNNYKGDYSITYKSTMPGVEGEQRQVFMRTSQGYYFEVPGMKSLFIKDGDEYLSYNDMRGNGLEVYGDPITQEQAEDIFTAVYGFKVLPAAEELYGAKLKKDGTETVAGRKCDKYSTTITGEEGTGKVSYCIDQQTGLILKSAIEGAGNKIVQECIEFKTSGITLPSP